MNDGSAAGGAAAADAAPPASAEEEAAARERRKRDVILATLRAGLPALPERSGAAPGRGALVRRRFEVALRPEAQSFAKFTHTNASDAARLFRLRSSHPAVVTLSPEAMTLPPRGEGLFGVAFAPAEEWRLDSSGGSADVLIFVNDESDTNVNMFKIRVTPGAAREASPVRSVN